MAKQNNAAKKKPSNADGLKELSLIRSFVEKGMGHGLVETEPEKIELEEALDNIQLALENNAAE